MPSIMVVLAPDGTIRDRDADDRRVGANRAFTKAVVWPDDQLVGRPFLDILVDAYVALGFTRLIAREQALLAYTAYVGVLHLRQQLGAKLFDGDRVVLAGTRLAQRVER